MNDAFGMPQSAVILGGTSEIACAVLRVLATRRLREVVLAGRDEKRLDAASKDLRALGVHGVATAFWDARTSDPRVLAADAASRLGDIDLVLVAAGVLRDQAVSESDPAATTDVISTNFTGPAGAMIAFSEILRSQGHGHIVVLSSVAGVRVRRANFVYGSSKAGLDALAQGLAEAVRPDGVGVTIVRPGWVSTRMTKGQRPAPMATTPEAVAKDVVRGLETGAHVVWSPPALRWAFAILRSLPTSVWRRIPY